ncbi:BLUF domain-containing protein [Hymenobacter lapidiphilus]|uniref:BLUF domain-containing protein n=1 Tax=Hymenobacter sp. CCM 8763 TaxID=2303334 RepID=UPI000E3487A4|nr:BLUF domain-containing protein [Hymenobacter sp. CCM 8763]
MRRVWSYRLKNKILPSIPSPISLFQLVYQSQATPPFAEAALEALLRKARIYNQAHHLTGMLLYVEGRFLQVIEGPEPALNHLYGLIQRDQLHMEVRTISYGPKPPALFPTGAWATQW